MQVNIKKPIRIINRTKYFNPDTSKTHVTFSSPDSYQSRKIKIEGYETRLYWQYRYCDEHNGQTFFYTLTYNDAHIPRHYNINCFDYEDLRSLLTGGFRKKLLRKYGTYFKYFVGAELGDGKGERGMHNNPHYHILFFLEDAKDPRFPYVKIDPKDFRTLVKQYWQGFDENIDGYHDFKTALYGIAREGDNCGLVTDFRACMYCAKYVCKDVKLKQCEQRILQFLRLKATRDIKCSESSYDLYFHSKIYSDFNIPRNARHTEWVYSDDELIERLLNIKVLKLYDAINDKEFISFSPFVPRILTKYDLWDDYFKFVKSLVDVRVHEGITEYRNRYCNKCRISQGLGDYALEFINDPMRPGVTVPDKKKGFKTRPLCLYYYRKLYTQMYTDDKGNKSRILNDLGMQYKINRLSDSLQKLSDKAEVYYKVLMETPDLFEAMRESDVNTDVIYHFSDFSRAINKLLETDNIKNIVKKYAEYKLVYEDRFFKVEDNGLDNEFDFPDIDVVDDYTKFIYPTPLYVTRSDIRCECFLETNGKGYMPYYTHPYFLRYISIFNVFDLCSDYFFIQGDKKAQEQAEEIANITRFHSQLKVKEFYKNFQK